MSNERIGIWLIGAWGGVSTSVAIGLTGLQTGLANETGLVSALPLFAGLELLDWSQFIIGGHEIRETNYETEVKKLNELSRVFPPGLVAGTAEMLCELDRRVRPGTLINVGKTIASFAGASAKQHAGENATQAIQRLRKDIDSFRDEQSLDHVIVVNLASTEPSRDVTELPSHWDELDSLLATSDLAPVPASTLYAVAALQAGCSYVNFTPSLGSNLPAVEELATLHGRLHIGRDGKTGETLLKSVLAPMFAARNLRVLSWVGHNIFGNMDGKVLDDPANKANKVRSKDHLLSEILGYKPQTLVSIEYIESMADWKTAWDHIHFQGFLDTQMTMQFIWEGCDSLLAAPLVLDLVRLTEREWRRGASGVMSHLASFFKSPMGTDESDFFRQFALLEAWVADAASESE